ncbi:MAG: cytochrome-c oxidase, cbb3-type subunit III [Burkholderiaceae bacterium]
MSDFTSSGWSIYVAAATVLSLIACLALLLFAARRKVVIRPDGTPDETTGHTWDVDLTELNNPLPRWWMWLFVITVLFSFGYLWLYPGLGSATGSLGWTSANQHSDEQGRAAQAAAPLYARLAALTPEQLAADRQAMGVGERLFVNHCATCHGSDARGSKGFPNLTDNDWLWGGTPEAIAQTISNGRQGLMPPMAAAVGSAADVRRVANYVLSLSGGPHDNIAAQLGREKFAACAPCHGAKGEGNPALGAPNLTDKVWLHGWGEQAVVAMITNGKTNVMPAHAERLSAEQIHVLAAYVWQLSRSATKAVQ